MDERDALAGCFEAQRGHLRVVAYRMLGSLSEADDADIANLGGWLTTVVGRVCLDLLRARRARREEPLDG